MERGEAVSLLVILGTAGQPDEKISPAETPREDTEIDMPITVKCLTVSRAVPAYRPSVTCNHAS